MRRIPAYLLVAICGLMMLILSMITIVAAVDFQSPGQLVPTVMAMLTQMPPASVATQLARMGYVAPPSALATAQYMFQHGAPADVIVNTLVASYNTPVVSTIVPPPTVTPNPQIPPTLPAAVATVAPPPNDSNGIPVPTLGAVVPVPTVSGPIIPTSDAGAPPVNPNVPVPTVEIPATPIPVEVGNISGSVTLSDSSSGEGIFLTLTRPNGNTDKFPVSADGTFSFANMEPGAYTLVASATGYLSAQIQFTLAANQNFTLAPATLVAGDTNGDDVIDLLDASLIASNFGDSANVTVADLNHDGQIDVGDLTIIGHQFGLAGPLPWGAPGQ